MPPHGRWRTAEGDGHTHQCADPLPRVWGEEPNAVECRLDPQCFGRYAPPDGETETVGQNRGLRGFVVRIPTVTRYFEKHASQRAGGGAPVVLNAIEHQGREDQHGASGCAYRGRTVCNTHCLSPRAPTRRFFVGRKVIDGLLLPGSSRRRVLQPLFLCHCPRVCSFQFVCCLQVSFTKCID